MDDTNSGGVRAGVKSSDSACRRALRSALDAVGHLDKGLKEKRAYRNVFVPEAIALRQKVKEKCELLMFSDPVKYGQKSEELLWRKSFYDVVQLFKKNRKHIKHGSSVECAYRTHLLSAFGTYNHLLIRVHLEYSIPLEGIIDWPGRLLDGIDIRTYQKESENDAVRTWALNACHRFLINMGDVSRYLLDFSKQEYFSLAERFYHQAIVLKPTNGLSMNQLGTLHGTMHQCCDAVFYYIRCLLTPEPFSGAVSNLQRMFDKNTKAFSEFSALQSPPVNFSGNWNVRKFLVYFIHLQFLFRSDNRSGLSEIASLCQQTLNLFQLAIQQPRHDLETGPTRTQHIPDDLLFKVIFIALMDIYHMNQKGSKLLPAGVAFVLTLFTDIVSVCTGQIKHELSLVNNDTMENNGNVQVSADRNNNAKQLTPIYPDKTHHKEEQPGKYLEEEAAEVMEEERATASPPAEAGKQSAVLEKPEPPSSPSKVGKPWIRKQERRRSRRNRSQDSDLSEEEEGEKVVESDASLSLSDDEDDDVQHVDSDWALDSESDLSQESHHGFSMDDLDNDDDRPGKRSENVTETDEGSLADRPLPIQLDSKQKPDELISKAEESTAKPTEDMTKTHHHHIRQSSVDGMHQFADLFQSRSTSSITMSNGCTEDIDPITLTHSPHSNGEVLIGDENNDTVFQIDSVLDVVSDNGLLFTVKLFCDWLLSNPHVIEACARSCHSLWVNLCELLTLLPTAEQLKQSGLCTSRYVAKLIEQACQQKEWAQQRPLTEDVSVLGLPLLNESQSELVYNPKIPSYSSRDEAAVRVCILHKHGYKLNTIKHVPIQYDTIRGLYTVDDTDMTPGETIPIEDMLVINTLETNTIILDEADQEEEKREQLMRTMAQLRLQSEVTKLESELKPKADDTLPPYIIPDAQLLVSNLSLVKQLVESQQFIVIIPIAVINTLDYMKKDTQTAREAIKYLETEFFNGNRNIRAQKSNETTKFKINVTIPNKDRQLRMFYDAIFCANYFTGHGKHTSDDVVTVLVQSDGNKDRNESDRGIDKAKSHGVVIETADSFKSKWKTKR